MHINLRKANNYRIALILVAVFLILIALISFSPKASSRLKSYYSGDAIYYNGAVYIATTDTGKFELFKEDQGRLMRMTSLLSPVKDKNEFHDVLLNEENGRLFAYVVNGNLLKYDISDPVFPILTLNIKDNSFDYFFGLARQGNKIVTLGSKGAKVWNYNYEVTHTYTNVLKNKRNILFSADQNYIFENDGNLFEVTDGISRKIISSEYFASESAHNRKMYNDPVDGSIYMVSDKALKKFNFDGTYNDFKHISTVGYDVDSVPGASYVYFSDGLGIVKLNKEDLKPMDWSYTTSVGAGGGWAMGLNSVSTPDGDRIIVFNGTNIALFDKNLDLIDAFNAREENTDPIEPLYLNIGKNNAFPGQTVLLNGGGFRAYEKLEITIENSIYLAETDKDGRFIKTLTIPNYYSGFYDIRVEGTTSKLNYSIGFEIL